MAAESPSRDLRSSLSLTLKAAWNAETASSFKQIPQPQVVVRTEVGGEGREIGGRKAGSVGEVLTKRGATVVHQTGSDGRPKLQIPTRTPDTDGDEDGGDEEGGGKSNSDSPDLASEQSRSLLGR